MAQSLNSLQIRTAEESPASSNRPAELRLVRSVTVYEAFSVFAQPIRIQLGEKSVTLTPDRQGVADSKDATFRVLSDHNYGVVYGGVMEFEVVLRGASWEAEVKRLASAKSSAFEEISVPLELQVGEVRHTTSLPLEHLAKSGFSL
jgi:hypothetical protein